MDYLYLDVQQEKKWLEPLILAITIHFSPEQIDLIDEHFMYNDVLLTLEHSSCMVREWLRHPAIQLTPYTLRLQYNTGTTTERYTKCNKDRERVAPQLDDFRWKLIKLHRDLMPIKNLKNGRSMPLGITYNPNGKGH